MTSTGQLQVAISPQTICAGTAADIEVRLTNIGPGSCTNVIFSLRPSAGLVLLRGSARLQWDELRPGESVASTLRVIAKAAGSYRVTSPSFSFQDPRGETWPVRDFAAEITASDERYGGMPQLAIELMTTDLTLQEWDVLRAMVVNTGDADASEVQVRLSGHGLTPGNVGTVRAGTIAGGASAPVEFHVFAREAGTVPIQLDLTWHGADRQPSAKRETPTVLVSRDRVPPKDQMKILFLGASPPDAPRLRIDKEFREIEDEIQRGPDRDRLELQARWAVRPADISRALLHVRPDLVHFAGHGGGAEESFAAEDETGYAVVIPVAGLVKLFKVVGKNVRCVLVNACSTTKLGAELSQALPLAYVIGTREPVGDQAAITFSVGFYQAMAAGTTVEEAFGAGVAQTMMAGLRATAPLLWRNGELVSAG